MYGPGIWVPDPYGLTSKVQPAYSILVSTRPNVYTKDCVWEILKPTMWYGSATTPIKLFGPTRYQWD
ncbi:hypothetical protein Golax_010231 [Gossypium laxum]|uniref:Uncharacterized protein n=1 Tax=Gossypium laxum TaxID=34288 RepID=A0A7J8ZHA9_9ROSI|nr:hypothetical protein [Gossypium laxum]